MVEGAACRLQPPSVSPSDCHLPASGEELLRFRVGGLFQFAFADGRAFFRSDFAVALEFDLFVALVDLGDANHMLVLGDTEDGHALRAAAHHSDVAYCGADHLALICDEHQRLALMSWE